MKNPLIASVVAAACISQASAVNLQDLLPMQEGSVVVTCSSGGGNISTNPDGPVVAIINTTQPELDTSPLGDGSTVYPWEFFHNELSLQGPNPPQTSEEWTNKNLGEVYGVTLDDQTPPNIYVSATTVYREFYLGPLSWPSGETAGSVYRLDGSTGEITTCVQLPNSTPALGNLTFHRSTDGAGWLYISNFDDGLIYRVSESCEIANTWDHGSLVGILDDPTHDWTQEGRRVWGVEVHDSRLYYGVWNNFESQQEIWSVALGADGNFIDGSELLEITVPAQGSLGAGSLPVSDIEFTGSGAMIFAERLHNFWTPTYWKTHRARVLEYTGGSGAWVASPATKFKIGQHAIHQNSAGGVAVNCNGDVWATGGALNSGHSPLLWGLAYGLQFIAGAGNAADAPVFANGYLIDYNGIPGIQDKTFLGEVELFDNGQRKCFEVLVENLDCPQESGAPFQVNLAVTNLSPDTALQWMLAPCPAPDLPAGATTVQPGPAGVQAFGSPLAPGGTALLNTTFPGTVGGDTVCFVIALVNEQGVPICREKVCIDFPGCDCFEIVDQKIECEIQDDGTVKFLLSVTLTNNAPWDIHHITLLPPTLFSPDRIEMTSMGGPIPTGGTGTFTTCVSGNPGDYICFNIVAHSEDLSQCCSQPTCLTLPVCEGTVKPDECFATQKAPCCPSTGRAKVTITICNNSPVTRSYNWNTTSITGGSIILPGGVYSPGFGNTGPVAPNTCWTTTVQVACEGMQPGDKANFEVCFTEGTPGSNAICCQGQVYVAAPGQLVLKQIVIDPNGILELTPGGRVEISFEASNPGTDPIISPLAIRDLMGALRFQIPGAREEEGEGESSLVTEIELQPGESRFITFEIALDPDVHFDSSVLIPIQLLDDRGLLTSAVVLLHITDVQTPQARIIDITVVAPSKGTLRTRFDLLVTEGATIRMESSNSLDAWNPVLISTDASQTPDEESLISDGTLMTIYLPFEATRNYFRAIAGGPGRPE